ERGAGRVLEPRRRGRRAGAHLGPEGARLEQLQRHVELLRLDGELDVLEVGGDGVVLRHVGADVVGCRRGDYRCGEDCCSNCCGEGRENCCSEDRETGLDRGWPETRAWGSDTPDHARHGRIIRSAIRAASHQSATMAAEPNGIQTSHSAIDLALSSPYEGIKALHTR